VWEYKPGDWGARGKPTPPTAADIDAQAKRHNQFMQVMHEDAASQLLMITDTNKWVLAFIDEFDDESSVEVQPMRMTASPRMSEIRVLYPKEAPRSQSITCSLPASRHLSTTFCMSHGA